MTEALLNDILVTLALLSITLLNLSSFTLLCRIYSAMEIVYDIRLRYANTKVTSTVANAAAVA